MKTEARIPNLLIVEDEVELSELISEQMRPLGYQIRVVHNAFEALAILKRMPICQRPDAVISDIAMPKMSGLELMHEALRLGIEVPFVFLTAYDETDKLSSAFHLGAFDFLTKPYEVAELLWTVDQAIELGLILRTTDRVA